MIIAIPMAGQSRRFTEAGLGPKHALPLVENTVFDWVVGGFHNYPAAHFVFVVSNAGSEAFVHQHAANAGIRNIHTVQDETQYGYGSAVFHGLEKSGQNLNQQLLISPIDTYRPHFRLPGNLKNENFVEICFPRSTGIYFFQNAGEFVEAFQKSRMGEKAGQDKLHEWAEWTKTLWEVNKGRSPMSFRAVNRGNVVIMGNPKEYDRARQSWTDRFGTKPNRYPTFTKT